MEDMCGLGRSSCWAVEEGQMLSAERTIADCLQLLRARFLDRPGLQLSQSQVQRLWLQDPVTCDALLNALIDIRFLKRTGEGTYERNGTG
jgi:hypothetical protein